MKAGDRVFVNWPTGRGGPYDIIVSEDIKVTDWQVAISANGYACIVHKDMITSVIVSENDFDLQPFDKVLARDSYNDDWQPAFFSARGFSCFRIIPNIECSQIARYEGNERYLGTTQNIPGAFKA